MYCFVSESAGILWLLLVKIPSNWRVKCVQLFQIDEKKSIFKWYQFTSHGKNSFTWRQDKSHGKLCTFCYEKVLSEQVSYIIRSLLRLLLSCIFSFLFSPSPSISFSFPVGNFSAFFQSFRTSHLAPLSQASCDSSRDSSRDSWSVMCESESGFGFESGFKVFGAGFGFGFGFRPKKHESGFGFKKKSDGFESGFESGFGLLATDHSPTESMLWVPYLVPSLWLKQRPWI